MAFDTFMWLEGGNAKPVKGETTDATYSKKNAFEIYSFSWGASNPVNIGSQSGGASAGKVSISSFNIMKKTDVASPVLFLNCCLGTHFNKGCVRVRKAGGGAGQIEFIEYDFSEVFVESVQWSGSSGGDDTPTESVSFAFGKVEMKYIPQKQDGTPGTAVPATYDQRINKSA